MNDISELVVESLIISNVENAVLLFFCWIISPTEEISKLFGFWLKKGVCVIFVN